jgi:two-component system nitrate/nitrite response regulator NarP
MRSSGRFTTTCEEGIAETISDRGLGLAGGSRDGALEAARIALVDNQRCVLAALRKIIEQDRELALVAACRCADAAMRAVQRHQPAVVILDVQLPDRDGVELIRNIAAISDARVIVFTAPLQKARMLSALRSGATAVVFKDQPASMLISCVHKVLAETPRMAPPVIRRESPGGLDALTAREREVAQWAAAGARNKEIAWQLGISEGTVKLHLFRTYRKLRVSNRVGLALALKTLIPFFAGMFP